MIDRARWHGEIGYFDAGGRRTGRELFSVSIHADGSRTLRAQCEMDEDALVRDCLLVLDREEKPVEAFVRLIENGAPGGTGWYRFPGATVEARILGPDASVLLQSKSLAEDSCFFGTHSLVNDGWLARLAKDLPEGSTAALDNLVSCSLAANGGGTPGIHVTAAAIEHVGAAQVAVPAGLFRCRHYRVRYGEYPPLDMWTTGPELMLVRMAWTHLEARYELLALTEASPSA
jgi:hypothetical protein